MDDEDTNSGALSQIASQLQDAFDPSTTPEAQNYARQILEQTTHSDYGKNQSQIYSDLEKNAAEARAALRTARENLLARRYNPADSWFALSAALGSPTQTGTRGEVFAKAAQALREPAQKRFEWEQERDKQALDLDEKSGSLQNALLALKLQQMGAERKNQVDLAKEALKTLGKRLPTGTDKAAQALDRAYAPDYIDWTTNGEPEASQALGELDQALGNLRGYTLDSQGRKVPLPGGKSDTITGPVVGTISRLPIVGKPIQDILFPKSANTQEMVESTVQRSLRPILGAQFTEREGENLINRVYNPRLDEEINAKRLERLITKLKNAYNNKQEAATYYRQKGTLAGFAPKHRFTFSDFMPDSSWPGEPGYKEDEEDLSPDDTAPAVDPNASKADEPKIIDFKDLPHRKGMVQKTKEWFGFAEGGAVPPGKILVRMPDGSVSVADPDATQEDLADAGVAGPDAGNGDRTAKRAALAATAGAAAGYPAARTLLRGLTSAADLLPGRSETSAQARLLRLLEKQGQTPEDLATATRRAQKRGVPATVMDVGPPSLTSLAETALPEGGQSSQEMLDMLSKRQAASRERVNEHINQALKPDEYFGKEKDLLDELYTNAKPLYQQAYEAHPSVSSPELFQMMSTPSGKQAVKKAVKAIRDKPGATMGKTDAMGMITKPSLEFLDEVKKQLDDMITKEEGSGPTYKATEQGKKLRNLRDSFVSGLDQATTDANGKSLYADARAQYAGDAQVLGALRSGRDEFNKLQPAQVASRVNNMSFAEKDAYRTGVAQNLYEMLNKPSTDINAARRLIGSPDTKAKLSILFDNPNEFRVFNEALDQEMKMYERSKGLLEQGPTVGRRQVAPQGNIIQRGAQKAPTLGIFSPTQWALRWLRAKPEITSKDAAEVIGMLRAQTPDELQQFVEKLGPKFGRAAARKKMRGKAGLVGAGIGAVTGALLGSGDNEAPAAEAPSPDDPTLAGLDEEGKKWATTPVQKRGGRVGYADGGKVSRLKSIVESIRALHPEAHEDAIRNAVVNTGISADEIRNALAGRTAPLPSAGPAAVAPPPTAALDALRRSIEFERNRMSQLSDALSTQARTLPPPQAEALHQNQLLANQALARVNQEPTYDNYNRLQQLVRQLAAVAGKRRGGRMQSGGMTTHA